MDSNTHDNTSLIINKTWTLLDLNELFNHYSLWNDLVFELHTEQLTNSIEGW